VTVPKKKKSKQTEAPRASGAAADHYRPFAALKKLRAELAEAERAGPAKRAPAQQAVPARDALPDREEEELALHRLMAGVTPLGDKPARIPRSQEGLPLSARGRLAATRGTADPIAQQVEEVHARLDALVDAPRFEVSDDGRRVEGRRVDLPPDLLRKLRHGRLPIDARLDLHGLAAGEAREQVERFLAEKRSHGERCVLVIHGRGEHSPRGAGVLRGEIAAWLSQGRASAHVAAFATATEDDGGEGAVYVLLVR
jgi:DNA-nicking Smr family endonuclease